MHNSKYPLLITGLLSLALLCLFQANALAATKIVATDGSGDYNCDGADDPSIIFCSIFWPTRQRVLLCHHDKD